MTSFMFSKEMTHPPHGLTKTCQLNAKTPHRVCLGFLRDQNDVLNKGFSCLSDTTHGIIMVAEAISEVNTYCRNKQLVYILVLGYSQQLCKLH